MRQSGLDEPARIGEVPRPPQVQVVDSAGVRRRRSSLPREICIVSLGTEGLARVPDRGAEVSRGRSRWRKRAGTPEGLTPPKARTVPRRGINGAARRTSDS